MDKDTLSSVALIGLLLVIILVALYARNAQKLVAYRPNPHEIVSQVLGALSDSSTSGSATCPEGCVPVETPKPNPSQKQQWQAEPIPYLRDQINQKFAKQIAGQELVTAHYHPDELWWRDEKQQYRIVVTDAQTFGVQVQTTSAAVEMLPQKADDPHPAIQHPVLKKVQQELHRSLTQLGYKKGTFDHCPVSESYDPFDNCVATYTRDEQKCSLIAGFGRLDYVETQTPYLRLELSCSDQYQAAYDQAQAYLYTLSMINPPWRVPDMAVHSVISDGDWSRVDFGGNYGIFQRLASGDGLRLVTGGAQSPSCFFVDSEKIPLSIYQHCQ